QRGNSVSGIKQPGAQSLRQPLPCESVCHLVLAFSSSRKSEGVRDNATKGTLKAVRPVNSLPQSSSSSSTQAPENRHPPERKKSSTPTHLARGLRGKAAAAISGRASLARRFLAPIKWEERDCRPPRAGE